jgi:hypothetical protein
MTRSGPTTSLASTAVISRSGLAVALWRWRRRERSAIAYGEVESFRSDTSPVNSEKRVCK